MRKFLGSILGLGKVTWKVAVLHIVKPESEVPKCKVPKSRSKGLGLTQ